MRFWTTHQSKTKRRDLVAIFLSYLELRGKYNSDARRRLNSEPQAKATRKGVKKSGGVSGKPQHSQASDRHFEFNTAGRSGSTAVLLLLCQRRLLADLLAFFLNFLIFERRIEAFGQVNFDIRVRVLGPDERGGDGAEQHNGDEDE